MHNQSITMSTCKTRRRQRRHERKKKTCDGVAELEQLDAVEAVCQGEPHLDLSSSADPYVQYEPEATAGYSSHLAYEVLKHCDAKGLGLTVDPLLQAIKAVKVLDVLGGHRSKGPLSFLATRSHV